jgi:hypothetical protein
MNNSEIAAALLCSEADDLEEPIPSDDEDDPEVDILECSNHDSASEQSNEESDSSEDNEPLAQVRKRLQVRRKYLFGKDKVTCWSTSPFPQNSRTRSNNIVTNKPGVKPVAKNASTPYECWSLFITDCILDRIVECTNIYIEKLKICFHAIVML